MNRTYKILVASDLLDKTTVFCVAEQEEQYRKLPPIRDGRLALVVGVRGLIQQKQFIYDYYPESTEVVMMDDDLEHFITWDKKQIMDIRQIINTGFRHCRDRGARLWGIYPVANPFFFSRDVSYGLKFIIGNLYGFVKRGLSEIPADVISQKEDIYRLSKISQNTLKNFIGGGLALRRSGYIKRKKIYFRSLSVFLYRKINSIRFCFISRLCLSISISKLARLYSFS